MDYLCLKGALVTCIILFKMAEDQNQKMHSIVFFLHGIVMPAIITSHSIITVVCVNETLQLHESVYSLTYSTMYPVWLNDPTGVVLRKC